MEETNRKRSEREINAFLNEGFMLDFRRKQNLNGAPYREGKLSFLDDNNDEVWSSASS